MVKLNFVVVDGLEEKHESILLVEFARGRISYIVLRILLLQHNLLWNFLNTGKVHLL